MGLQRHPRSKNLPSRRSLRRHLTLGILVRSRQSSAEGREKEAHSDMGIRPQVVWPPLELPRSCPIPGPGKGLGTGRHGGARSSLVALCPPLPGQTRTACACGITTRGAREHSTITSLILELD